MITDKNGKLIKCNKLCVRVFPGSSGEIQCLTRHSTLNVRGREKSIADIEVGDEVEAFDENSFIPCKAVVVSKQEFVPKKLYRVDLEDGSYFCATGNHKIIANGKWCRVDELLENPKKYNIMEIC